MLSSIRRRPPSILRRRRPRRRDLAPGRYLTDRERLLCVLARFEILGSMMVWVEDCKTFDRHVYAEVELERMRCRRVWTPARPAAHASHAPEWAEVAAPPFVRAGAVGGSAGACAPASADR